MLKKRVGEPILKVPTYSSAIEVLNTNKSPEDIPEIERKYKTNTKRPRRSLPVQEPTPTKAEEDQADKEVNKEEPDCDVIIPVLSSDETFDRFVAEGNCNPKSWTTKTVRSFLLANELDAIAKQMEPLDLAAGMALAHIWRSETSLRSFTFSMRALFTIKHVVAASKPRPKLDGASFLKQNRQTLGIQLDFRYVLVLMKFVTMLRQLDQSYNQKQNSATIQDSVPEPEPASPMDHLKRRLSDDVYASIVTKRAKYCLDPDGYAKDVTQQTTHKQFPGGGQTPCRTGSGRPKICYNCQEEGHLGRECPKPKKRNSSASDGGYDAQKPQSFNEDWEGTASPQKPPVQHGATDDDWDAPGSTTVNTLPASSKSNRVQPTDTDDWDNPVPIAVQSLGESVPIQVNDDWDAPAIPAAAGDTLGKTVSEPNSWSSPAPPRTYGEYNRERNTSGRGRGCFAGGGGRGRGGRGGSQVCFRCNKEGHMSRECTESDGNRRQGKKICYNCQEEGHLGRECPKPKNSNFTTSDSCYDAPKHQSIDEDWGSTTSSQKPPVQLVAADDDWDVPATVNRPPTSGVPAQVQTPDDCDATAPKAVHSLSAQPDDDWNAPAGNVGLRETVSSTVLEPDNWSSPAPPSTYGEYNRERNGSGRGRGGFSGGRGRGRGGRGGSVVCFRCNKEGHMSRECTESDGNRRQGNKTCYNCQEEGHLGRDCPKPRKRNCKYNAVNSNGDYNATQTVDEDWGSTSTSSQKPPVQTATTDDDWDAPAAASVNTPRPPASFKPIPVQPTDDDWDAPVPKAVPSLVGSVTTQLEDDWGAPAGNTCSTDSVSNTILEPDNFSPSAATSTYGEYNRERNGSGRGRGGFSGGRGRGRGGRGGSLVCFRCNKEGHMSRECTESEGTRRQGNRICYNCQEEGHLGRECPKERKNNSVWDCNAQKPQNSDEDWGSSASSRKPVQSGATDDDWDVPGPATVSNPPPSKPLPLQPADDWDAPVPKAVHCLSDSAPARPDDSWDAPAVSTGSGESVSTTVLEPDDWSSPAATSTYGEYNRERSGSGRGRGGFSGGRGRGRGGRGGSVVCFRCNKEGHMSRECTESDGNGRQGNKTCYNCQEEGHLGRECPKPRKRNSFREGGYEVPKSQIVDEAWGSAASAQKPPLQTATTDDDWDVPGPATVSTLPASSKPAQVYPPDDWDAPVPKAVHSLSDSVHTHPDENRHASAVSTGPGESVSTTVVEPDDWSSPAATSTYGDYNRERNGSGRGRGGFSGGRGRGRGGRGGSVVCFRCNKEGHMSRECTESEGTRRQGNRICYNCQEEGHLGRDCTKPRKRNSFRDGGYDSLKPQISGEDWTSTASSQKPPVQPGALHDDWDVPGLATVNAPSPSSNPLPLQPTDDWEWDAPLPKAVHSLSGPAAPAQPENDWDAPTGSAGLTEIASKTVLEPDNWSSPAPPSTYGECNHERNGSGRRSGGFSGETGNGHGGRGGSLVCFRCNKEGHISRECTESEGTRRLGNKICYNCQEERHLERDCEKPRKRSSCSGDSIDFKHNSSEVQKGSEEACGTPEAASTIEPVSDGEWDDLAVNIVQSST